MEPLRLFQVVALPGPVQDALNSRFDVVDGVASTDPLQALERIAAASPPVDALFVSITGPHLTSRDAIAALPDSVKAIATYSVGLDHIDLDAARARGIAVFNTPGVLDDAVADAALLLLLGAARRGHESLALLRDGRWEGWSPRQLIGLELAGRTMGIVGMGAIGSKIARRAAAFGMKIAYHNRRPAADAPADARFVADPDDLVRRSDVIVLACPSTPQTRNFMDRRRLMLARSELILINIGRGDLVDDEALIEALSERRIFSAGLDVFNGEPAIHPGYRTLTNIFMTPHIGSSTMEARMRMGQVLIDALSAWRNGRAVANRVV